MDTPVTKENVSEPFDNPHSGLLEYYCIRDVEVTEKVYYALLKEQNDTKSSEESFKLEMQVQAIISEQERNGFKLDIPYAMQLLSEIKARMSAIDADMESVFPTIVRERFSDERRGKLR